jgi:hypothetical protein
MEASDMTTHSQPTAQTPRHAHEWDSEFICTACDVNAIGAYEATLIERDTLAAQNAVLREALQALPGAVSMAGDDGGWVWLAEWEAFEGQVATVLAEPAPRADALLAVVEAAKEVVTVADRERFGSENRYNAPGHAHLTPPYWDMGEECERCRAWMTLLDALARLDGEGE